MRPLPALMVDKPWGRDALPLPFATPPGRRIGEIWFEPPAELAQILIKYIFTSAPLSVQVHPSSAQAPGEGKEECWLVIAAEPGARLGIGLGQPVSAEALRAAALDGSIEGLLAWHEVRAGDFFYIPAGTIHAIGAGVSLVEVQQNSDTTYRLYDYGRPRDLHLDQAVAVARREVFAPHMARRLPDGGAAVLADGPHFRLEWLGAGTRMLDEGPALVVPLGAGVCLAGAELSAGGCVLTASAAELTMAPGASCLVARALGT